MREAADVLVITGEAFDRAVYVFTRSGTTWSQQAYIKASNTGVGDALGISVALSADGDPGDRRMLWQLIAHLRALPLAPS